MQGDKPLSGRRFLGYTTAGLRTTVPTLVRWPTRVWLAGAIVLALVAAAFLMMLITAPASAAPPEKAPLDCLSCHTRVLQGHDILGEGSKACWACHDSRTIGTLRRLNGTQLLLADSTPLCGQCHTKRYQAWNEGRHGILPSAAGEPGVPVTGKLKCIDCHNPHQPKIELSSITRLPPISEEKALLDCLSCHTRVLQGHDKLGKGSQACWACHSNTKMGALHLAGGETLLSFSESSQLCAQCHQARYEDWIQGTHGMPSWEEGRVEVHGIQKLGCTDCHDPHQPQMLLLGITKPHPEPVPPPPSPPTNLIMIVGISLLLIIGVGVITRGVITR